MRLLSKGRALLACVLAAAALAAALIGGLGLSASSGATGDAVTAPSWLQEKATRLVTVALNEPSPAAVSWQLATAGQYARATAIAGVAAEATTDSARPLYVVVARGDFTYTAAHLESADVPPPTGQTLVVAYDPETQVMSDLTLMGPDDDPEASLGALNSLLP
ncbi:MAG TPA: hypothetical protein VJ787_01475 [Thermoleophilia bacterium]|nr:hypothetical protein [Thermoleophilia bacterium]